MNSQFPSPLFELISSAISQYPHNYEFPTDGENQEITLPELESAIAISDGGPYSQVEIAEGGHRVTLSTAYDVAILGVRIALYVAHKNVADLLSVSMLCLIFDENQLDWRDVLTAMALIERCAREVGVDFDSLTNETAKLAGDRRRTLLLDYLAREPALRTSDVMGYRAVGESESLKFIKCI